MLEVISPSQYYYPDFASLKETFGDSKERVKYGAYTKSHDAVSKCYKCFVSDGNSEVLFTVFFGP